ncbi:MAG: hypothetical protein ACK5RG_21335 [Cyclobacteriaceae bacterium]|jgi:hypothetical protein
MGVRVQFWETPQDDIKKAIRIDFEKFKVWYLSIAAEFPDDVNYDILDFIERNTTPDKLFEEIDHKLIDELVAIYIGEFCDYGPGNKKAVKDSTCLNVRNYESDFTAIQNRCDRRVVELWNYILRGKSIMEPRNIEIANSVFRYSVLSEGECQFLLQQLSKSFNVTTPDNFNRIPGIGSVIRAIENKEGIGLLITVA